MKLILKSILIILGIALILFLWSISQFGTYTSSERVAIEKQAIEEKNPDLCNKLPQEVPDTKPRANCHIAVAVATKNTDICREYNKESGFLISTCYLMITRSSKDIRFCDELHDLMNQNYGIQDYEVMNCYSALSYVTSDESLCNESSLNDGKILCHLYFPNAKPNICSTLENASFKQRCEQYFKNSQF